MLGMHGIRYGLKNPEILKAELKALKRVSDNQKEIGLLLPQIISVEEIQKVKQALKEINFLDAKIGVMIETPAAVQIISDICKEGIDFISFGTNDLTQYILAVDRGNEKVQYLYDEMNPAILRQLSYVIRTCKRNNVETSICGQAGSKKEMVKFLVGENIDSISVNADIANEITQYISELEKGTDKEPRNYEPKEKEELTEPEEKPKEIKEETEKELEETLEELEKIKQEEEKEEPEEEEVPEKTQEKTKDEIEEDIKAIEEEKEEYLEEHPEEKEELTEPKEDEDELQDPSDEPEKDDEVLNIF